MKYGPEVFNLGSAILNAFVISLPNGDSWFSYAGIYLCAFACVLGVYSKMQASRNNLMLELAE
jgi:hypothetical protein